MSRLLMWVFIGVAFSSVLLLIFLPGSQSVYAGITLGFAVLSAILVRLLPAIAAARRHIARRRAAIAAGRFGWARIDQARRTGLLINDNPQIFADLTVSLNGQLYRTSIKTVIDLFNVSAFQVGSMHPVAQLSDDGADIALLSADEVGPSRMGQAPKLPPAEHVPRHDDLPAAGRTSRTAASHTSRRSATAPLLRLVAFGLGVAIMVVPQAGFVGSAVQLGLKWAQDGKIDVLLTDQQAITSAVAQLQAATPSQEVTHVVVRGTRLEAAVLESAGSRTQRSFIYGLPGMHDYSGVEERELSPFTAEPEEVFGFADVPWDRLVELHAAALHHARKAGHEGVDDTEQYIVISRRFDDAVTMSSFFPTPAEVSVTYDAQGKILRTSPPAE